MEKKKRKNSILYLKCVLIIISYLLIGSLITAVGISIFQKNAWPGTGLYTDNLWYYFKNIFGIGVITIGIVGGLVGMAYNADKMMKI
jgi:hypothetical protein